MSQSELELVSYGQRGVRAVGVVCTAAAKSETGIAVLMCPGITADHCEKARAFVRLGEALAERGIPSMRLDWRGRGDSGGEEEDLTIATMQEDLADAIRFAESRWPTARLGVVARGMGANAALRQIRMQQQVDVVVLWGLIADVDATHSDRLGHDYLEKARKSGWLDIHGVRMGLAHFEEVASLAPLETCLRHGCRYELLHPEEDLVAPVGHLQSMRTAADAKHFTLAVRIVSGADHFGLRGRSEAPSHFQRRGEFIEETCEVICGAS